MSEFYLFNKDHKKPGLITMQLFYKNMSGRSCPIDVSPLTTIEDIKQIIADREGGSVTQQRLVCNGRTLRDGTVISDYNVAPGMTIELLLRMLGG